MTTLASARSLPENTSQHHESWPRQVSREPNFTIGAVVNALRGEFPATTVSKIRFLEEQGLVKPHRNAAGYRKYSEGDITRIKFILTQQRDSYAPLRVIGEKLAALDAGHDVSPAPVARLVTSEGITVAPAEGHSLASRELCDLTGATFEDLDEYVRLGLLSPDLAGYFPSRSLGVVSLIRSLAAAGIPARNLRGIKNSAERDVDLIDQSVLSRHGRNRPDEKERARAEALELMELFGRLHREFLRQSMENLTQS